MASPTLTWSIVDSIAAELGANEAARRKWRATGRGVPSSWRIRITEALLARGVPISLAEFEKLDPTPGRIAA